ncbi:MAG: DUF2851 family protein [Bacteroidaceae bacterium]|nr:DUF2851 family protein [Bacteroidaceae bacterium]
MEQLLHYCWKHKIFPLCELKTTDGQLLEVLNPGRHNTDAGPDFLDVRVKLDGVLWAGNVEIHVRASDWHRHGHDGNPAYENIILHVVGIEDEKLTYPNGQAMPQLLLKVPQYVTDNYDNLLRADTMPPCRNVLADIPRLLIHSWMSALQVERLEMRTQQIMERHNLLEKNWEDTLFVTIARSFGFGKNGDAFERWAYSIPMSAVGKHRDNLLQVEAIFFGQAGLLDVLPPTDDDYFNQLRHEYKFLRQKFSLTPISVHLWKFLRLRPQNFPYVRIAQLATMYHRGQLNLSRLLNADSVADLKLLLQTQVGDYWRTHYRFGPPETEPTEKHLSDASLELLIINAVSPLLFCYARYKNDEALSEHAVRLLETLKPETNSIIRNWREAGVEVANAADTQALLQLHTAYCIRRDCLRCRFGFEYIRRTPGFLRENK